MKKYINGAFFAIFALSTSMMSCTVEEGTEPNSSSAPVVTLYSYEPTSADGDGVNPDNDVKIRFVANNASQNLYYLVDDAATAESEIAQNKDAYIQKVMNTGTKVDNVAATAYDHLFTGLVGAKVISAVAQNGAKTFLAQTSFYGVSWTTITTGMYHYGVLSSMGLSETLSTLQKCDDEENLYRLTDVLGRGKAVQFTTTSATGEDEDGKYVSIRIAPQSSNYTYGSYGNIWTRDVANWQNDASYAAPGSGFDSGMYEDGTCFLSLQYYVTAGSLGYNYDYFIAGEGEE
ncbi:MAG: hypothetical protein K2H75_09115 [Muribaculaceae bacterium]|nr:hypothetical protein [Muribaculaceae bacterium]